MSEARGSCRLGTWMKRPRAFCIRDANGQALAYVYFEDEHGRRMAMKRLTRDEARRIAANFTGPGGECAIAAVF
jgi:hypothetical protein